jgi:excisionase family DNA binding protein
MPQDVATLTKEVRELKQLILNLSNQQATSPAEKLLTIQEAADFLNLSVPTIYSKVSRGELPVMKRGKKLHFSSTELMQYLKDGRKKTNSEIETEAQNYLQKHR